MSPATLQQDFVIEEDPQLFLFFFCVSFHLNITLPLTALSWVPPHPLPLES